MTRSVAAAAVLGLGLAWWSAAAGLASPWSVEAHAMPWDGALATLVTLLAIALAGRVLLAWLPAGRIGGHGLRELPLTWAASHFLGSLLVTLVSRLFPDPDGGQGTWLLIGVALLGLARVVTLPAAMVPRHPPRHAPPSPALRGLEQLALGLFVVLGLALAAGVGEAPPPPALFSFFAAANYLAAGLFLRRALLEARLAPAARLVAWSACMLAPVFLTAGPLALGLALALCVGLQGAVGWSRRASRRSLALSLAGWTQVAALGRPELGLLGVAALLCATARSSRREAARGALLALVLGLLAASHGLPSFAPDARRLDLAFGLERFGALPLLGLLALALAWAPFLPARRRTPAAEGHLDPPDTLARTAAVVWIGLLVSTTLLVTWLGPRELACAGLPLVAALGAAVFGPTEVVPSGTEGRAEG